MYGSAYGEGAYGAGPYGGWVGPAFVAIGLVETQHHYHLPAKKDDPIGAATEGILALALIIIVAGRVILRLLDDAGEVLASAG